MNFKKYILCIYIYKKREKKAHKLVRAEKEAFCGGSSPHGAI